MIGGATWRVPRFECVGPGESGGVSVAGTLGSIAGAGVVFGVAWAFAGPHPELTDGLTAAAAAGMVVAGGLLGSLFDSLPQGLFEDLVSAFRQDTTVTRYESWPDLLDYCRRSANPVGRLVLRIAGHDDARADLASDAVCTALQLTNFWQDLAVDWSRGRLYVPAQEYRRTGASTASLDERQITPAWRDALSAAAARTRELFARGRGVCDEVGGRLRWELRLTWLGGTRILDRLERDGFNVFAGRPTLTLTDAPLIVWKAVEWRT